MCFFFFTQINKKPLPLGEMSAAMFAKQTCHEAKRSRKSDGEGKYALEFHLTKKGSSACLVFFCQEPQVLARSEAEVSYFFFKRKGRGNPTCGFPSFSSAEIHPFGRLWTSIGGFSPPYPSVAFREKRRKSFSSSRALPVLLEKNNLWEVSLLLSFQRKKKKQGQ